MKLAEKQGDIYIWLDKSFDAECFCHYCEKYCKKLYKFLSKFQTLKECRELCITILKPIKVILMTVCKICSNLTIKIPE